MSAPDAVLRVLLADDHEMVREGLRALLEREPGLVVVGDVSDGLAAVARAIELCSTSS